MKKALTTLAACAILAPVFAEDILVNTPSSTLLLKAEVGQPLHVSYYGGKLNGNINQVYDAFSLWEDAYPAWGAGCQEQVALAVKHYDGDMSTELVVTDSPVPFPVGIENATSGNKAQDYVIHLKDKVYAFYVDVHFRTHTDNDVIETWTVIFNKEKKPISLEKYASGFLPIRQGNVWITHEHGNWGDEAYLTREPLTPGMKVIENTSCTRNARQDRPEVIFTLDGKPQENSGRAIGAVLCWSGNYRLSIDTRNKKIHSFIAGINPEHSTYTLKSGETFTTPTLAYSYSTEGVGGVSRSFHRWARNGMLHNGMADRKVLLNSWEGVYMDVNQKGMEEMMDGISQLGGELFVMDDGWFGTKYRRTNDSQGLGDWKTDTIKLPEGVPALVRAAENRGLKFGIWIEPEMVNTKSELYEAHPEWIVCHPARTAITDRGGTQLVLDMTNPKVQDFVFNVVDNLMKENPSLYYIKWDCNMDVLNFGSSYLTADNQSHFYVDFQRGLITTMNRIRAKYPDLVIQACSSGGGRVNYGLLPYFDEFWVSDNTDAQQRLFLQWSASLFFPSNAMGQHVSASPNHQTGRRVPLKFRFDVAMTGRLGMEMQPKSMNERELNFSKRAIQTYKELRPLIQRGNLYRLINPYDKTGYSSEMYVSDDKSQAVFFVYKYENYVNQFTPRFYFDGLDPDATYQLNELNCWDSPHGHWEGKTMTGRFLMEEGIEIDMGGEFASHIIKLTRK